MTRQRERVLFAEQGYLVLEDLLSPKDLSAAQAEVARLHRLGEELAAADEPASRHFQHEPYASDKRQDGVHVLRKIENTLHFSKLFHRLSMHPGVLRIVRELVGPDLLLFRSSLMLKPAFHGSAHGFHQDSAYWPMEPPNLVTVSIMLNDTSPENGCFKIIPRSHKWGLQEWGRIVREYNEPLTDREDIDLSGQIDVSLPAGSALVFHSLIVHGSGANRSSQPRNTALYAYFSPDVRYVPRGNPPTHIGEEVDGGRGHSFPVAAGLNGQKTLMLFAETP